MKSARRTFLPRLGALLPALVLAVAGTVVAVTPAHVDTTTSAPAPAPKTRSVSYAAGTPIGKLDRITQVPGGIRATGWAIDPNQVTQQLQVFSSVDHKWINQVVASVSRPDVAKAYPAAGPGHGFVLVVPVPEGDHTVCVGVANVGAGTNLTLGCQEKVRDYGPYGGVNKLETRPGSVFVRGWLADNDTPTSPVTAVITIDGVQHRLVADKPRPDVAKAFPIAGANHGFEVAFPVSQGLHNVCVSGINIGAGSDNVLACRTITLNDNPLNDANFIGQSSGKLAVRGWTFDRDAPTTALTGQLRIDNGAVRTFTANRARPDVAKAFPGVGAGHGYDIRLDIAEGTHTICVNSSNIGFGTNNPPICRTVTFNYQPTVATNALAATSTGVRVSGWAVDPDTSGPVGVRLTVDGTPRTTITANVAGPAHGAHNFTVDLPTVSGKHTVCATALNVGSGTRNSAASCQSATLTLKPLGSLSALTRSGNNVRVTGWAFDPDTTAAASVTVTLDGKPAGTYRADAAKADLVTVYPSAGKNRGFNVVLPTTDGEHTVCATVENVGAGSDTSLGCRLIIAVNPVVPSPPLNVTATSGYGSSTISWTAPASDGGAPPTSYVLTTSGNGPRATVNGTTYTATIGGLKSGGTYRFSVQAVNVVGRSAFAFSTVIRLQVGPAPQTTPAPISTSRYLRNIRTCSAPEAAVLRNSGIADAKANPAGHRYMMLLDIGGQNQTYGGVVLSATTRFVSYPNLLACSKSYVAGYASAQRSGAPATIAIGVNNDMDVNAATGRDWATKIVNPLVAYARPWSGITIAGANDIEPGFSASYTATKNWVAGYLSATTAKFVFNGSADGCAWTVTNRSCNNGWTMSGLYNLAAGAAPAQIINLPQVYNYTMADQWKYISLTGVGQGAPRINFGGPLTEATACAQAGSCDSIGGYSAWQRMWNNLQSTPSLKVGSLPYATDLRIDS